MYQKMETRNIAAILNPRPLTLVTVIDNDGRYNACTVAWTMPLSYDPALLAVALKPQSKTAHVLTKTGKAALNFLTKDQANLAREFGSVSGNATDKHVRVAEVAQDSRALIPPIIEDSLAYLQCELREQYTTGDHQLFVLEVREGYSRSELKAGLLYSRDTLLVLQRDDFAVVEGKRY